MIKGIAKFMLPLGRRDMGFQYLSSKEIDRFLRGDTYRLFPMWSEGRLSSGKMCRGDIIHMERYRLASKYCNKGWILDFACGSGYGSEVMRRMGKNGTKIMGMDADIGKLDYSRKNFPNNDVIHWNFDLRLPFRNKLFDNVISMETLEHLENDFAFVLEAHRCLKVGGCFVFSVPIENEITEHQRQDPLGHKRTYTEESIKKLIMSVFGNVDMFNIEGESIMGACQKK